MSRTLDYIGPTVPVKPPLPGCGGDQQLNILDSIPPGILAGCELLPLVLLTVLLAAMTDWPPLPHTGLQPLRNLALRWRDHVFLYGGYNFVTFLLWLSCMRVSSFLVLT